MSSPATGPRVPQQARSIATRELILRTAEAVLVEGGWAGFTIAAVSRRCGVSVGSIYQHFGDKDGLFTVIHDTHLERLDARAANDFHPDRWPSDLPAHQVVHDVVTTLGAIFRDLGDANGVIMLNAGRVDGLFERGALTMARLRQRATDILRTRITAPARTDPELTVAVCYRMAFSTFLDFATFRHAPGAPDDLDWPTLTAAVADACTAYAMPNP